MSEKVRSIEEIKKAIQDYMALQVAEFQEKYVTNSPDEAKGFVKGLRWVLKL